MLNIVGLIAFDIKKKSSNKRKVNQVLLPLLASTLHRPKLSFHDLREQQLLYFLCRFSSSVGSSSLNSVQGSEISHFQNEMSKQDYCRPV